MADFASALGVEVDGGSIAGRTVPLIVGLGAVGAASQDACWRFTFFIASFIRDNSLSSTGSGGVGKEGDGWSTSQQLVVK